MAMLQTRWRKGRLGESLTSFLQKWMPQEAVAMPLTEAFDLTYDQGRLGGEAALAPLTEPLWQALLHLPALRDFWTAELRAAHYLHLLHMIPPAWCMDPTPLPPGTVIAGLGITGWAELPRLEATGPSFARHEVAENKVVLTATSAIGAGWRARYALWDGQITLQEAFLL